LFLRKRPQDLTEPFIVAEVDFQKGRLKKELSDRVAKTAFSVPPQGYTAVELTVVGKKYSGACGKIFPSPRALRRSTFRRY
jgi:hypothetical protein